MEDPRNPEHADPTDTTDLDDGHLPETSLADVVDDLEQRVLAEEENPVLDVGEDADAAAVADDPEFGGDDAQPPT
jgi:hypothetical protein